MSAARRMCLLEVPASCRHSQATALQRTISAHPRRQAPDLVDRRRWSTIICAVSRAIPEFPAHRTRRHPMNSRRHFIVILPFAGLSAISACSDKAAPTSAAPAPTPMPAPAPPPAPESATAPAATATPAPQPATTATGPMVDPAEPAALALGYVAEAKTTKDPKHAVGAACTNCALFAGKPGEAAGPCPLFPGKQVAASGWCTAYQKKA